MTTKIIICVSCEWALSLYRFKGLATLSISISVSIDACNGPHWFTPVQPTPSVSIIPNLKHWPSISVDADTDADARCGQGLRGSFSLVTYIYSNECKFHNFSETKWQNIETCESQLEKITQMKYKTKRNKWRFSFCLIWNESAPTEILDWRTNGLSAWDLINYGVQHKIQLAEKQLVQFFIVIVTLLHVLLYLIQQSSHRLHLKYFEGSSIQEHKQSILWMNRRTP